MLAYRHAFHAGNHADVLKHLVLMRVLDYLNQKPKPYWVVDTHAGAGAYALDAPYAARNAEFETGIGRLWSRDDLSAPLAALRALVAAHNPGGALRHYPGSPALIQARLRDTDRLRCFELHPTDFLLLEQNLAGDRRAKAARGDGFAALKALLPPPPRRGLVLIDPPYELKTDYPAVLRALDEALARFADGVYLIWYPVLGRREPQQLVAKLKQLPVKSWLHAQLTVAPPNEDGIGLLGSGMFVLNPPWTLHAELAPVLPELVGLLGQYAGAGCVLEQRAG